jgi:hypothetical protein
MGRFHSLHYVTLTLITVLYIKGDTAFIYEYMGVTAMCQSSSLATSYAGLLFLARHNNPKIERLLILSRKEH